MSERVPGGFERVCYYVQCRCVTVLRGGKQLLASSFKTGKMSFVGNKQVAVFYFACAEHFVQGGFDYFYIAAFGGHGYAVRAARRIVEEIAFVVNSNLRTRRGKDRPIRRIIYDIQHCVRFVACLLRAAYAFQLYYVLRLAYPRRINEIKAYILVIYRFG